MARIEPDSVMLGKNACWFAIVVYNHDRPMASLINQTECLTNCAVNFHRAVVENVLHAQLAIEDNLRSRREQRVGTRPKY